MISLLKADLLFQRDIGTCQILQVCGNMKPPTIGFHLSLGKIEMKSEKEIKGDAGVDDSLFGSMKITYKHQEYGEHSMEFIDYGFLYNGEKSFQLLPKYREFEGHKYYLSLSFKAGLEVDENYELDGKDTPVSAHLEIDDINGDRQASGKFNLSRSGDYPKGTFDIYEEGVFSAAGEFEYMKWS